MSGRRVKSRVAIACDAAGALDAVAATGTLTAEEDGSHPGSSSVLPIEPIRSVDARSLPGRRAGSAPQGRSPVRRGRARRSAA